MPDSSLVPWPSVGAQHLSVSERAWLSPSDDYWRAWLRRPELALVPESCVAEEALHAAMLDQPSRSVMAGQIDAMRDPDVRENWRHFLRLRDAVRKAGTLEAAWAGFFARGAVDVPPLFLDLLVQAMVARLLEGERDALVWRAAELLFRRQRIQLHEGRVLCGDEQALDMLNETGGLGSIGSLLRQAGAHLAGVEVAVLGADNAETYMGSVQRDAPSRHLLDLTHTVQQNLPHGLVLTMDRAQSGLTALARVLERWIQHLHGVQVHIEVQTRVEDPAWRWHVGLDAEATLLLNDLYNGETLSDDRQRRLLSLFRLRFADPDQQREDVRGKSVYLGLAMNAQQQLRLKPQNLLLNLPLSASTEHAQSL
ncbi:MAG: hypothetical protein KF871_05400 [Hydrogenophaga sp.]|uniref:DUF6352 family protein n=1 Tax=Hydrogenophaga sp. TaxID=1904254 RepID=UPI001DDB8AAD|nr:DUF6352 family protein [Hydrogenophaga sp.]MBX3609313.1 hypothetical protein [Hydrogenophaga sp.]